MRRIIIDNIDLLTEEQEAEVKRVLTKQLDLEFREEGDQEAKTIETDKGTLQTRKTATGFRGGKIQATVTTKASSSKGVMEELGIDQID